MKTSIIAILTVAASITPSYSAIVIELSADISNSDESAFGGSVTQTLTDTFSYNPDTPQTPSPDHTFGSNGHHGAKTSGLHTLSYSLTGGSFTTSLTTSSIYFDFYGRDSSEFRDDNYTVTLFNGDYTLGNQVSQQAGQSADDTTFFNRTTFNLGAGTTFDRIQVTSPAGPSDVEAYFTVMEVRAAAVPEPSSAALLGLAGLGFVLRRHR